MKRHDCKPFLYFFRANLTTALTKVPRIPEPEEAEAAPDEEEEAGVAEPWESDAGLRPAAFMSLTARW